MEIAVFGGTFDPPTVAHEAIIDACIKRSDIDEVWLLPSGVRADKPGMQPDDLRIALLQLLETQSEKPVRVSDFELTLPRPTKTYRTVEALKAAYPDHTFWFVFGADSYATMETWEQGEMLKKNLSMLLVKRLGYECPQETGKSY